MKILRDTEWTPVGYSKFFEPMNLPVYFFQNKKYGDVVALNVVKFINVTANLVHYYNANYNQVSDSRSQKESDFKSNPIPKLQSLGN